MQIGRVDIFWNYSATIIKLASSVLLYPIIFRVLPTEEIAIWNIFISFNSLIILLDFGFNQSFTRNISYIFSGVKTLQKKGIAVVNKDDVSDSIDYSLLKGTIKTMRWFYKRVAIVLFVLLLTAGSYYIYVILKNYNGNTLNVYVAWIILCVVNTYQLYTLYFESLLQGKGLVKRTKQIVVIGQIGYFILAYILIVLGFGLIAIISAQLISVFTSRILCYKAFFTNDLRKRLSETESQSERVILKAIYPNAIKFGLTSLGAFLVTRSSIIIGSLFLSLEEIASYGITMQFIAIINSLAIIYLNTYQPKIAQFRAWDSNGSIKYLYIKGQIWLVFTYTILGIGLIFLGEFGLRVIGSQTFIMNKSLVTIAILISFLEANHGIAGSILASKNEVPYFKASLLSGVVTVCLLLLLFKFSEFRLLTLLIAPGIAQLVYQNWKWPYEVIKDLNISLNDLRFTFQQFFTQKHFF